jgi:hypothetical protein
VDYAAVGLSDYGKPARYVARQVSRWTQQYRASATETIEAMERLIEWLPQHVPADDETSSCTATSPGQHHFPSVRAAHPGGARLGAVHSGSSPGRPGVFLHALSSVGRRVPRSRGRRCRRALQIPSEEECVADYCRRRGRAPVAPREWTYYLAFCMFRLAAILQGVLARAIQGNASSATALEAGRRARPLAEQAWGWCRSRSTASPTTAAIAITLFEGHAWIFPTATRFATCRSRVSAFMDEFVYPAEPRFHEEIEQNRRRQSLAAHQVMEELKRKARAARTVESVPAESEHGAGLSNLEYAPLCEIMGRSHIAPGGLQLLGAGYGQYGGPGALRHARRSERWLVPLLEGRIRSAFAMTEPDVASSDATNIQSSIVRDGAIM